ncbi:hypothetical protein NUW58_g153 [Xylaria curta]|uniref:Uncharacterized protein n=1 Tax=Xylaria curta TaxID=42375 RepID=A0ACC1PT08_9PEZI|nr:hypothetical protein NUW58_g153 [Xylaria curta]
MRPHVLVVAFAAAGTIADANRQSIRRGEQTAVNGIGFKDRASPGLLARSSLSVLSPLTRRTNPRRGFNKSPTTLSRRDHDDHYDNDHDGDGGGDDDYYDYNEDYKKDEGRTNTAAIVGGVLGGVIVVLIVLFLLFWFKFRPRMQNRRRKRREDDEEERKRKEEEERERLEHEPVFNTGNNPRSYQPVATDEPPNYQQVFGVAGAPQPSPQRGTAEFPAELPSPVDIVPVADGREPSSHPSASPSDYSKGSDISHPPKPPINDPDDRPPPTY